MRMGTGQWTSGQRATEESLHTMSLWEKLEKVRVWFLNALFQLLECPLHSLRSYIVLCCESVTSVSELLPYSSVT